MEKRAGANDLSHVWWTLRRAELGANWMDTEAYGMNMATQMHRSGNAMEHVDFDAKVVARGGGRERGRRGE